VTCDDEIATVVAREMPGWEPVFDRVPVAHAAHVTDGGTTKVVVFAGIEAAEIDAVVAARMPGWRRLAEERGRGEPRYVRVRRGAESGGIVV
jgi:hypothetical protein